MIIFKITNKNDGKVYIGMSKNDNPHNLGSGKYIKRAVASFGAESFDREILHRFTEESALSDVMDKMEEYIKKYKSDNPKYGYNESINENIPQKRRLTKKIQVLLTPEDEDMLNSIIIQKSMENNTKPVSISKYVRSLIQIHIAEEAGTTIIH